MHAATAVEHLATNPLLAEKIVEEGALEPLKRILKTNKLGPVRGGPPGPRGRARPAARPRPIARCCRQVQECTAYPRHRNLPLMVFH